MNTEEIYEVYKKLQELTHKYNITIVTATQPPLLYRRTYEGPINSECSIIFIDYIDLIKNQQQNSIEVSNDN